MGGKRGPVVFVELNSEVRPLGGVGVIVSAHRVALCCRCCNSQLLVSWSGRSTIGWRERLVASISELFAELFVVAQQVDLPGDDELASEGGLFEELAVEFVFDIEWHGMR